MPITDAQIKAAIRSVSTEFTLNDGAAGRGSGSLLLVARRLANGGASAQWFAQVKRAGKRTKLTIGRYPEVTLAMARQRMAAEIGPALRDGKPLRITSEAEPPTVERMFAAFVAHLRDKGRRAEYADEVERMLLTARSGNAAEAFGRSTAPAMVTPAMVADHIRPFIRKGKRGAGDKARAYISAAFGWAIKAAHDPTVETPVDWGLTRNPVEDVKRDESAGRTIERNLSAGEIRQLWLATAPDGAGFSLEVGAAIRLVLCCGQRIQETLRIDGREIDLAAGLWRQPAEKTKGGERPHVVPLPRQAIEILHDLIEAHGDGPLFPAREEPGERIRHRSIRQAITRWLKARGGDIEHFTPRDLRRTWKSRAGDGARISKECRDLIQQHARDDTGSVHYDRADYLPQMREAMAKWEAWLDDVLEDRNNVAR